MISPVSVLGGIVSGSSSIVSGFELGSVLLGLRRVFEGDRRTFPPSELTRCISISSSPAALRWISGSGCWSFNTSHARSNVAFATALGNEIIHAEMPTLGIIREIDTGKSCSSDDNQGYEESCGSYDSPDWIQKNAHGIHVRGRNSRRNVSFPELNVEGYQSGDGTRQERENGICSESKIIHFEPLAQHNVGWIAYREQLIAGDGDMPTNSSIEAVLQLTNSENNQATGLTSATLVKYTRKAVPLNITGSLPRTAPKPVVIR
jgi:hypothetical protein